LTFLTQALSEAQKLDIYLPTAGEGPFPVIIAVHGGGFLAGDKRDRQLEPNATWFGKGLRSGLDQLPAQPGGYLAGADT
jgi:hypothetical protein